MIPLRVYNVVNIMLVAAIFLNSAGTWFQKTESYYTVFLQGSRVGYTSIIDEPTTYENQPAKKESSRTFVTLKLTGATVQLDLVSETISVGGRMKFQRTIQKSGGKTLTVEARFNDKLNLKIDNNGSTTTESRDYPKDKPIVSDGFREILPTILKSGKASFYTFDAATFSCLASTATVLQSNNPKEKRIQIEDGRVGTDLYVSESGEIVRMTTSIGTESKLSSKAEALSEIAEGPSADLALVNRIVPSPTLNNPQNTKSLRMRLNFSGKLNVPSDLNQTARKENGDWLISAHPLQMESAKSTSIASASAAKPEWVKASNLLPSNLEKFKSLSRKVVGNKKDVRSASLAIRKYVNELMTPDAGIGVLRDANDVLASKRGVCRDYAVLTATLLRSANIPTRLVGGMVSFDGDFYYHAWVEVWTGYDWVPLDSVPTESRFTATHVKLSQGNVDQAFSFAILSGAKLTILDQKEFSDGTQN